MKTLSICRLYFCVLSFLMCGLPTFGQTNPSNPTTPQLPTQPQTQSLFSEDFESGQYNAAHFTAHPHPNGIIEVTSHHGPIGMYHLLMHSKGQVGAKNFIDMHIDLSMAQHEVVLKFFAKKYRSSLTAKVSLFDPSRNTFQSIACSLCKGQEGGRKWNTI